MGQYWSVCKNCRQRYYRYDSQDCPHGPPEFFALEDRGSDVGEKLEYCAGLMRFEYEPTKRRWWRKVHQMTMCGSQSFMEYSVDEFECDDEMWWGDW